MLTWLIENCNFSTDKRFTGGWVLLRLTRGDLVPGLQELDQDLVRRLEDVDLVLLHELLEGVGVLPLPLRVPADEGLHRRGLDDFLVQRRELVPHLAVDQQLAHRHRLVHAGRVVVLPHVVEPEPEVLDAADPLRAVDDAALGGRQDLAAGQVDRAHPHLGVDLGVDPGLAALHALEVGQVLDRPLEPAERLRAARERRERDDVQLQHVLVELLVQLVAPALVHPAEDVDEVHPEVAAGAAGEEHRRLVLADPVVGDGVGAVDDLLARRVEDLEGRDDRAGG